MNRDGKKPVYTHTMLVICAWCGAVINAAAPCRKEIAGQASHGMCPACLVKLGKDIQKTKGG